jgi:predicted nucleotidyltransferase
MTQRGTATLKAQLKAFCERLKRLYGDPVVVLCGSTALGESMPWSDIDLIVVADFEKPFLDRLSELALLNDTGLRLEVLGYTPAEFKQMLDNLNPGAIEAVEFGIPILPGRVFSELKEKLAELKKLGVTKTSCTYLLAKTQTDGHSTTSASSRL